jgi:hypothetical protein
MIKPRHWSRAGIYSLSAAKEKRSKLLRLRYAIFSNHYRRPFCAAANRSMKNKPAKLGQKSTATQKVKHDIYRKRQKPCLILQKA